MLFLWTRRSLWQWWLQQTRLRGQGCDIRVAEDGGVCDQGGGITCVCECVCVYICMYVRCVWYLCVVCMCVYVDTWLRKNKELTQYLTPRSDEQGKQDPELLVTFPGQTLIATFPRQYHGNNYHNVAPYYIIFKMAILL